MIKQTLKQTTALLFTGGLLLCVAGAYGQQGIRGIGARRIDNRGVGDQTATDRTEGRSESSITRKDQSFAQSAAGDGLFEVEMGRLAQTHARNSDVRAFARRMVEGHTSMNNNLKQLAGRKGIGLPGELKTDQRRQIERLADFPDESFDREYIHEAVLEYRRTIDLFERQANQGSDPDLKQFAANTLPHLRDRLQQAEGISKRLPIVAGRQGSTLRQTRSQIPEQPPGRIRNRPSGRQIYEGQTGK